MIHWKLSSAEMIAMQVIFSPPLPLQLALDSRVLLNMLKNPETYFDLLQFFEAWRHVSDAP